MEQELIKCSCCGKMVPANNIELTFPMPDDILNLDQKEVNEKCKFNDDIYVYNDEKYYIRCILPLPVHDTSESYCIGVWVELSLSCFNRVWDLWDEEDKTNEPLFSGLLASQIPLTENSQNSKLVVQLKGVSSRPEVFVKDKSCSLYLEQTCGITMHRAREYSDLCRR